jgi:hypothetical protein
MMQKLVLGAALIAAFSWAVSPADAQGRRGIGGPPGGTPPTWQGSNPPGFSVEVDRPGWSRSQSAPGWNGSDLPPGLAKQPGRH